MNESKFSVGVSVGNSTHLYFSDFCGVGRLT